MRELRRNLTKSQEYRQRANKLIAQGALTNSKRPTEFVQGVYPYYLVKGDGAYVWDADGNKYIDYIGSLGCNLLGYNHPKVSEAIINQVSKGTTHSLPTTLEVECTEKLKECFPFCDKFKIFKTGSEACSAAVRIARTYTRRNYIQSVGYHGHHAEFVSLTPPALGVLDHDFIYEGTHDTSGTSDAGFILEPIELDISEERTKYLTELRNKCTENGTLLIFDEIITAGRFPKLSISRYFDIYPDLFVAGKCLANGMPLAIVGGREEIMECGDYFTSGTFNGETLSMAACIATLTELQKSDMNYLWKNGQYFIDTFNTFNKDIQLKGYPTRCIWEGDETKIALLWQEACKAGIIFGRAFFYGFEHIRHNDLVLMVCKEIATRIDRNIVKLEGELPKRSFKR
jgi:glutamate-1-semialdehyde 2,1-aminomutase